jgi:2-polyprenyl-6-methoxyphenol hydroxylase-like FAD-dependent oxidoreductase
LAAILQKFGIKAHIIEKQAKFSPRGTGILLNYRAVTSLKEVGLDEGVLKSAQEIKGALVQDQRGQRLAKLDFSALAERYGETVSLPQNELLQALSCNLASSEIWLNTTIQELRQDRKSVRVVFSDNSEEHYFLVVGADGLHSRLRKYVFKRARPLYAGYACWRFMAKKVPGLQNDVAQEYWGRGKRFGIVPLRNNSVWCYALFTYPKRLLKLKEDRVESLRAQFGEFGGTVSCLLDQVSNNEDLLLDPIEEVRLRNWVKNRVVLIGDAAHALTPNLGQGAALAIEDAIQLSQHLNFGTNLKSGLRRFNTIQGAKAGAIQSNARRLGRFIQFNIPILCVLRNALMRYLPDRILVRIIARAFYKHY